MSASSSIRSVTAAAMICALIIGSGGRVAAAPNPGQWVFACTLTEPFWTLSVSRTKVVIDDGSTSIDRTKVQTVSGSPTLTLRMKVNRSNGAPLQLTITDAPGSDGMSDLEFSHSVVVEASDVHQSGGCERLSDGALPNLVVGVPRNDVLNIRSAASTTAAVLDSAGNGAFVWRRVGAANGSWVPVEMIGRGERGPVKLVRGWANTKYLRPL